MTVCQYQPNCCKKAVSLTAHILCHSWIIKNFLGHSMIRSSVCEDGRDGRGEVEACGDGRLKSEIDKVDGSSNMRFERSNTEVEIHTPCVL